MQEHDIRMTQMFCGSNDYDGEVYTPIIPKDNMKLMA